MYTEPSPEVRMSGDVPSRDAPVSGTKYHEAKVENSASLTLYFFDSIWLLTREYLPGRITANQSGFYFPGVMRQVMLEMVQKPPEDCTYNPAINFVKNYLIPKTVTNFNTDLTNTM